MKHKKKYIALFLSIILVISFQQIVTAQDNTDDDNTQNPPVVNVTEAIDNLIDQDLEGTAQGILSDLFTNIPFLNNLSQIIQDVRTEIINFKIPSTERIKVIVRQNIETLSSSSERLEDSADNPTIIKEIEEQIIRQTFKDIVEETTLSTDAQRKLADLTELVQKTAEENIDLGDESQTLDVSQQILQNISKQQALTASNQSLIINQNTQAQVDRAMNNLLQAQIADELAAQNAQERREKAGTYNLVQRNWGMFAIPGEE